MMITVNRVGTSSITGSVNMVPFGIKYTEEKYNEMKRLEQEAAEAVSMQALKSIVEAFELLTKENFKELVESIAPNLFVNEATGQFFLKHNGVISSYPLPKGLVDRITKSIELGIDFAPIERFWVRTLRSPVFSKEKGELIVNYVNETHMDGVFRDELIENEGVSPEIATERATRYQTPITMEGLLCSYKVSREKTTKFDSATGQEVPRYAITYDEETGEAKTGAPEFIEDRVFEPAVQGRSGDAFTSEGVGHATVKDHIIRVGCRHFLDNWSQVNTNDYQSCVKGLHIGNLDYIRGYQNAGTETHNVFVDPMHIGAITDDGSGALRVFEYFVHSSFAGPNRSIYHSSNYAKLTDAQWEVMREEAIANSEKRKAEMAALVAELAAL